MTPPAQQRSKHPLRPRQTTVPAGRVCVCVCVCVLCKTDGWARIAAPLGGLLFLLTINLWLPRRERMRGGGGGGELGMGGSRGGAKGVRCKGGRGRGGGGLVGIRLRRVFFFLSVVPHTRVGALATVYTCS